MKLKMANWMTPVVPLGTKTLVTILSIFQSEVDIGTGGLDVPSQGQGQNIQDLELHVKGGTMTTVLIQKTDGSRGDRKIMDGNWMMQLTRSTWRNREQNSSFVRQRKANARMFDISGNTQLSGINEFMHSAMVDEEIQIYVCSY